MSFIIKYKDITLASDVKVAKTFGSRLKGLMFEKEMKGMDGLLLDPCNSIHTFFMRYPNDVVFLTRSNEVKKVIKNMSPWRMSWIYFGAQKVLELKGGSIGVEINKGEKLEIKLCINS